MTGQNLGLSGIRQDPALAATDREAMRALFTPAPRTLVMEVRAKAPPPPVDEYEAEARRLLKDDGTRSWADVERDVAAALRGRTSHQSEMDRLALAPKVREVPFHPGCMEITQTGVCVRDKGHDGPHASSASMDLRGPPEPDYTKTCDRPLAFGGTCQRAHGHSGPHRPFKGRPAE